MVTESYIWFDIPITKPVSKLHKLCNQARNLWIPITDMEKELMCRYEEKYKENIFKKTTYLWNLAWVDIRVLPPNN